jgi:lipoprotein NlpI
MKKIIGFLSLIAVFTLTACSNEKSEVKKEVIVVPGTTTTPPPKNTTVVVDKNGVQVGTKKVDVTINPERKK